MKHRYKEFSCGDCPSSFSSRKALDQHRGEEQHYSVSGTVSSEKFFEYAEEASTFGGNAQRDLGKVLVKFSGVGKIDRALAFMAHARKMGWRAREVGSLAMAQAGGTPVVVQVG